MQNFIKPVAIAFVLLCVQCSFLKLDPETNCLNDKAGCFKEDKTRPQLAANGALSPLQDEVISTLGQVDLLFTEELNNPQPADFVFSGAADITVNAVQQLNKFTYRLLLTQNSLASGPIFLDFPNLKDYNGNKITGSTTVSYVGNVNIPITLNSVSHYGVSNSGGYTQIDVSWRYVYVPPSTPPNSTIYTVRLTTGSEDCNVGTPITPSASSVAVGTAVASYDNTNSTTIANTTHTFSVDTSVITVLGAQKILICVANAVQNKYGTDVISLVRDDSAPTTSLTPAAGFYASPRTLTFNCSDNADKVIFTSATTVGTGIDPLASAAADPTFNTTTGAVITGTLYNANAKPPTPYSADPTHTIYKYRCIDQAGNIEAIRTSGVYRIDSTFPTVTLAHVYKSGTTIGITGVSSGAFAYQSADFVWRTNQVNKYWELRVNGTSCGAGGTVVTSGLTTGTANAENTTPVAYNATGIAVGENPLLLCVGNNTTAGTSTVWGQESFSLLRDDTEPSTPVVNIAGGNYGSRPSLVFSCSDNQDNIAFTTATAAGSGVPATPTLPDFDLNGVASVGVTYSEPIQPLDAATTTYRWRCIDRAGNKSVAAATATYRIDSILPTITIVSNTRDHLSSVAGYTSTTLSWRSTRGGLPFEIRRNSTNCVDGTLLNSPATVSGTTNADINQNNVSTFDIGNFAAEGEYTLMICVRNYIDQWGFTYKTIKRDNTAPTFAGLTTLSTSGSGNFTLNWAAADDATGSGIAYYNIYRADALAGPYVTAQHMAAHPATSINVTVPVATNTYYFVAGAVDNAGNETKVTVLPLATTPTISVTMVSELTSTNFTLSDGAVSAALTAATTTTTAAWSTTLGAGSTYNFSISNVPAGKICSIRQRQFGTLSSNINITIDCIIGYMVGGRYQSVPAAPLNYMLYRGISSTAYSGATSVNGVVTIGNMIYFVRREGTTDSSIQRCDPTNCAATLVTIVNQTAGVMRHLATEGTNLYAANPNGSAAAMRIYKYSALLTAQAAPQAEYNPALTSGFHSGLALDANRNLLYVGLRGVAQIKRIHLDTGVVDTLSSVVSEHEGMALLGNDLYVATPDNGNCILKAANAHTATALALYAGACGATESFADGPLLTARFARAHGIVSDGTDLYIAEFAGARIRRIDVRKGFVSTIAGGGAAGTNGTGPVAGFANLFSMATDGRKLYASEGGSNRLRVIADSGLVAYWPLDGNLNEYASDGTVTKPATINGDVTTAQGRYGAGSSAYAFDGVDDYISVATGSADTHFNTGNFSVALWVRPAATQLESTGSPRDYDLVTNWFAGQYDFSVRYHNEISSANTIPPQTPGQLIFLRWDGTVSPYCISGIRIDDGNYHHVVAQKYGSLLVMYIDGKKVCSVADTVGTINLANVGPVRIGARPGTNENEFTGNLSDVRIYKRALSEGEINELAQDAAAAQVGSFFSTGATGLLSHYEFAGNILPSGPIGASLGNGPLPSLTTGKDGDPNGAKRYVAASSQYHYNNDTTGYPIGNQARTQCVWVNPASYPSGNYYGIIQYGSNFANGKSGLFMRENSGSHYLVMPGGGSDHEVAYKLPLNAWTHLCGSYDGSLARLYVNGNEQGTAGAFPLWNTQTGPLGIGRDLTLTNYFDGKIDDVRIYNNTLSAAQIRQLATQVPAGLMARYDFNGDSADSSGFANTLTATGSTVADNDRFLQANSSYRFNGGKFGTASPVMTSLDNVSLSAWFKQTTMHAWLQYIVINGSGSNGYGIYLDGPAGNVVSAILGGIGYLRTTVAAPLHVWNHVALVRSAGTWSIYLNGVSLPINAIAPATITSTPALPMGGAFIGLDAGAGNYFEGAIDDARFYNRALSATEIRALAGYHPMQVSTWNATPASSSLKFFLQPENATFAGGGCSGGTNCVSAWNDTSGNGFNVAQATGSAQPVFTNNAINTRPAIKFIDANSTYLTGTCQLSLNSPQSSFFTVFQENGNLANNNGIFQNGAANAGKMLYMINSGANRTPSLFDLGGNTNNLYANVNFHVATENVLLSINHTGATGAMYKNGASISSTAAASSAYACGGGTLDIGRYYFTAAPFARHFDGLLGDFIFFSSVLSATSVYGSATDHEIVECYLSSKYSIPRTGGAVCP